MNLIKLKIIIIIYLSIYFIKKNIKYTFNFLIFTFYYWTCSKNYLVQLCSIVFLCSEPVELCSEHVLILLCSEMFASTYGFIFCILLIKKIMLI